MRFRVYAMRFLDVTVLFPYTVKTLFKGTSSEIRIGLFLLPT